MPRRYLVPENDLPPGQHHAGRVVHEYANGAAIVESANARGEPGDAVPSAGLNLPVAAPRGAFAAAQRSIRDAAAHPAPENEGDVSAYVEFVAPADSQWLSELSDRGVTVIAYQPDNSYLVRGRPSVLGGLVDGIRTSAGDAAVRSVTELTSALKTAPAMLAEAGEDTVVVIAAAESERRRLLEAMRDVPGVELRAGPGNDSLDENRLRIRARVDAEGLRALLALPHVLSVESFGAAIPDDELAGLIIAGEVDFSGRPTGSYDGWLGQHGLDGSGAVIGIVDGGVDVTHPAFAGRARDLCGGRKDWHATMVAGHAAGAYRAERDGGGYGYGLGTAPASVILSQDRNASATSLCAQTASEAGSDFAVQNNSWGRGGPAPMDYGSEEALYDAMVRDALGGDGKQLTICFSSGNTGPAGLTRPKAAKNVIVTGNSENFRPEVGGADSDSIGEVYVGTHPSSVGNCADGRIRPHVVAPGEWTASAAYDVRPGEPEYVSPRITWGGGSSGASPKTAGACALLAQWWRRWHAGVDPSPAMLRALLVNGAEPIRSGGPIPNNVQGWGRLSLRETLDPRIARVTVDQSVLLSTPGQAQRWPIRVVDPTRPVKVTLAWTDPPGAVGSGTAGVSAIVNRLALRVEDGIRTWRGGADRFRNGWSADDASVGGGSVRPEGSDNLQCVFLPPGQGTTLTVTVTALAVTTDAYTGGFGTPQQDFALVITNAESDDASGDVAVVAGVASNPIAPESTSPDEDAWWHAGQSAPEASRRTSVVDAGAGALNASADGVSAEMLAGDMRAGAIADALRGRLTRGEPIRAVVLGVPARYNMTAEDGSGLRALASVAELYLVADAQGLSALVDVLGPHPRVRYRLVVPPVDLVETLRDVLMEAAGLEELVVSDSAVLGSRMLRFDIVAGDTTLIAVLPGESEELVLTRPGDPPGGVRVGDQPVDGARITRNHDRVQLVVDRPGDRPGVWTVQLPAGTSSAPSMWVQGASLRPAVEVRNLSATSTLVLVSAPAGALLTQLSIPPGRLISDSALRAESDRPIMVGVRPSRLDVGQQDIAPEAAGRPLPVPALGRVVDHSADSRGVLDIPIEVFGVDAGGAVFARRVHANIIPPSVAAGSDRDAPAQRITAYITDVVLDGDFVRSVRVSDGRRERVLSVGPGFHGTDLAELDRHRTVILRVRGAELESVFVPLS